MENLCVDVLNFPLIGLLLDCLLFFNHTPSGAEESKAVDSSFLISRETEASSWNRNWVKWFGFGASIFIDDGFEMRVWEVRTWGGKSHIIPCTHLTMEIGCPRKSQGLNHRKPANAEFDLLISFYSMGLMEMTISYPRHPFTSEWRTVRTRKWFSFCNLSNATS